MAGGECATNGSPSRRTPFPEPATLASLAACRGWIKRMARPDVAERLNGWKAIAAFFARDERTVKRWEATRGLPVRRMPGGGRAAVWADTAELRRWMVGEGADEASAPA